MEGEKKRLRHKALKKPSELKLSLLPLISVCVETSIYSVLSCEHASDICSWKAPVIPQDYGLLL